MRPVDALNHVVSIQTRHVDVGRDKIHSPRLLHEGPIALDAVTCGEHPVSIAAKHGVEAFARGGVASTISMIWDSASVERCGCFLVGCSTRSRNGMARICEKRCPCRPGWMPRELFRRSAPRLRRRWKAPTLCLRQLALW